MIEEETQQQGSLTARASWVLLGRSLSFVFGFALPLLLVRRLTQADFGLYKQVFLFVSTAMMLLPLGFHMSAFYFLPREQQPRRQRQVVLNILLFYLLVASIAGLTLILWPGLLRSLFNSEEMVRLAPRIALVVVTWVVASFLEYVAIANQEIKLSTLLTTVANLTRAMFLVGAALLFGSVDKLVDAAIIQGLLQVAVLGFYLRSRFYGFWRDFEWPMMRTQLSYALPFGLASILLWAQSDMHNYFVARHVGPADYAIYAVGCFQIPLIIILSESVGFVMVSRVSYLQKTGQLREITELTARVMRKLAGSFLPLYAFLLVAGREFIEVLFTKAYLASWPIFAIYLTMIPLSIAVSAYDPIMRAYAEHRYFLLKLRILLFVALFTTLWFGTVSLGMVGVILVVVGVGLVERMVMLFKAVSILGASWRDALLLKDVGKLAISAAIAGIVTAAVRHFIVEAPPLVILAICGIVFGLVYVGAALLFGVLTLNEREAIRERLARLQRQLFGKKVTEPLG